MGLFINNLTFEEGGGITSKLIPKQLSKTGLKVGVGISAAVSLGKEMVSQHNRLKAGPITYGGGLTRMTTKINSGALEAIQDVTNDPQIQADMLKKILRTRDNVISNVEEYGVDGQFLSAFYGMGV